VNSNQQIEEQARHWSVELSSGEADKTVLDSFKRWREADPRHEEAFQAVDKVWLGIAKMEHLRAYVQLPEPPPTQASGISLFSTFKLWFETNLLKPMPLAGFSCALLMFIGLVVLNPASKETIELTQQTFTTDHGVVESFALKDNTTVTLAPESRIQVSYSNNEREVTLQKGEVLFSVTHDPERPFVVVTGKTETTVLGTVFSVKRSRESIYVGVKEGRVQVAAAKTPLTSKDDAAGDNQKILTRGQGVSATLAGLVAEVQAIDENAIGAWKTGRLVFQDAMLKDIISDANRYYKGGRIIIASENIKSMKVSISFEANNIDQMLENLTQVLPLKLNRELEEAVVIENH